MMRRNCSRLVWLSLALAALTGAQAKVALRHVFGDNMVLQRNVPIPVFGTADDGEQVTVTLNGKSATTSAKAGVWRVDLPAMPAVESTTLTVNDITVKNVAIGEVWIASGQSNMGFTLGGASNGKEAVEKSANPNLRFITIPHVPSVTPAADFVPNRGEGLWNVIGPANAAGCTAVGYFFARDVQKALGVPVGLINSSWGGTPAEAWTAQSYIEKDPLLQPMLPEWDKRLAAYPAALEKYNTVTLPRWKEAVAKAKAAGTPAADLPRQPRAPEGANSQNRPANLYNGMIVPLLPFALKGAIWYQGESNSGRAYQYRKLMPTMIQCWRDSWKLGDFPFYQVQLAPFMAIRKDPQPSAWAELREAQNVACQALPKVGLAVITDVGEEKDIHPKQKEPVGARLALLALAKDYGQRVVCEGPTFVSAAVAGATIRVKLDHTDGGLVCRGDKLTGFVIAGADKEWVNADAKIDGTTLVVSSADVKEPVAVRFGWADFPVVNLWNGAGLPANPFRSDDWPGVTWPK